MDYTLTLVITFSIFFLLLAIGMHIHNTLLLTGIIGLILLGRGHALGGILSNLSYPAVSSYSLTTIPLFVLTAQFILQSGSVERLFTIIYNISRGRKGILGSATLITGAFLGAVSGSGSATAASLGQAAYPQLVKHGYSKDLAAALSGAAGSLSSIIPPSVVIIVYGVATETSISDLFMAAIIPGVAITLVYILVTLFFLKKEAKTDLQLDKYEPIPIDKKEMLVTIAYSAAVAITIFGGIYSGFMTPTEAGAVSAVVALVGAVVLKKVDRKFLKQAGLETIKVSSMVMLLIIAAKLFGRFMSMSLIARKFIAILQPFTANPPLLIAIIIAMYFVLFMLLEGTAVMLMTTPFLIPLMAQMGLDLVWFGILVCLTAVIGLLTPPVGMCVYAVAGAANIPVEGPFRIGIIYAIAASIIVGALMIFVPEIATLLPSLMK